MIRAYGFDNSNTGGFGMEFTNRFESITRFGSFVTGFSFGLKIIAGFGLDIFTGFGREFVTGFGLKSITGLGLATVTGFGLEIITGFGLEIIGLHIITECSLECSISLGL